MKLFGWKSAGRDASRPVLSRGLRMAWTGSVGDAGGQWPQGYDAQVRAGYGDNAVAQRSVRIVAESVGSAPVNASDPAVARLIATTSAGQGLMETLAAQLLLHGNGYVQILCDAEGMPGELFALRPERVSVEPDGDGWPVAYLYRVGDRVTRLMAEGETGRPAIIHLKSFNPVDDHYGMGCLGAASGAVAVHNAATRWNKALIDNAARPSGALVHDPGEAGATLSNEQFDRLKAELATSYSGAGNAGRPLLLEGGLRWQSLSLTPAELDFQATRAAAAREIALAFGVPPMLLGLPGDATYANYREANRALWRLTVLPLTGKILDGVAQGLRHWWPEARLSVDLDRVTALADERMALWEQVAKADFLTPEEKRAMVGVE